jgi:hypothetical protein
MIKLSFGILLVFLITTLAKADVLKSYDEFLKTGQKKSLAKLEMAIDKDFKELMKKNEDKKVRKKIETELDIIKTYFPYKLPMKFLGRNMYLNCYPSFDHFLNFTSYENLNNWRDCLSLDFGNKLPKFHQTALKAFNKHSY